MFEMRIETGSAPFAYDHIGEIARIMGAVWKAIDDGASEGLCRDTNNNVVGTWKLTDEQ